METERLNNSILPPSANNDLNPRPKRPICILRCGEEWALKSAFIPSWLRRAPVLPT